MLQVYGNGLWFALAEQHFRSGAARRGEGDDTEAKVQEEWPKAESVVRARNGGKASRKEIASEVLDALKWDEKQRRTVMR
jgi:hypothetical protein